MFPLLGLLLLGLVWSATSSLVRSERTNAEEVASTLTRELLETYEAQVLRALREIDQTLKLIQYEHEQGDGVSLVKLDSRGLLPPGLVFEVSLFDRHGVLIESTGPAGNGVDAASVEVEALRSEEGTAVGPPAIDRSTGEWTLSFSRPLRDADGELAGAAIVVVESAFFVSSYEPEALGSRGALVVLGTDGVVRALRVGDRTTAGLGIDALAALDEDGRVVRGRSPWDGEQRFMAARVLYAFPLAVAVGISVEEALAPAARQAAVYWTRAAAGSLLLIAILTWLGRMSWQLQRIRHREYEAKVAHLERVEYLAHHDALTDLPNRSLFSRLLERSIRLSSRRGSKLAVMFIDLDRFKEINDTLGHEAGDELLRKVARRLRGCLRESDTVARLGGDEFVVLLPELSGTEAAGIVADTILDQLAMPFVLLGQELRITGSLGISVFPDHGADEQTLTKNADIAMYQAKQEGRNSYRFYSEEINTHSLERLALESRLRHAMESGEFELHYQAKRDARSGRITGVEALLRWEHPELATVTPARFLAVAEETGLIVAIGRWTLQKACRQNVAWQREGLPRLRMAVNVTAPQFFDEGLVREVSSALDGSGMDADLLELEISERLLLGDLSSAAKVLNELAGLGVRLVLDQFGVGYSSLAGLEDFPLSSIKIDRSFVRHPPEASAGLTDAVVAVGRALSLVVVGQGVETDEQAVFLREHGCDELQGFHVHWPMAADRMADLLRDEPLRGPRYGPTLDPLVGSGRSSR
ncbi:MAG TPA: EAL domain-containing protein [Thermoanaerobaculia bacterium]|nr:EAL domain-containing protein [Thermoanaerobaculia bacterium]